MNVLIGQSPLLCLKCANHALTAGPQHLRFSLPVALLCGSDGKESACNAGDLGSKSGSGRSPGEGKQQPTPVFLAGESHGQRSLAGCSPRGHRASDTTERLTLHVALLSGLDLAYSYTSFRYLLKCHLLRKVFPKITLYKIIQSLTFVLLTLLFSIIVFSEINIYFLSTPVTSGRSQPWMFIIITMGVFCLFVFTILTHSRTLELETLRERPRHQYFQKLSR